MNEEDTAFETNTWKQTASTEEPSGASTKMQQVISRDLDINPAAVLDEIGLTIVSVEGVAVDKLPLASTCSMV